MTTRMAPETTLGISRRLDDIITEIDEVKVLAKETNGRIKEIELWRARMQGAAVSAKVIWLVAGGAISAVIIEILNK